MTGKWTSVVELPSGNYMRRTEVLKYLANVHSFFTLFDEIYETECLMPSKENVAFYRVEDLKSKMEETCFRQMETEVSTHMFVSTKWENLKKYQFGNRVVNTYKSECGTKFKYDSTLLDSFYHERQFNSESEMALAILELY